MVEAYSILFRKDLGTEGEFEAARKYFFTTEYRSQIPNDSLVIPRYSYLPFHKELDKELKTAKNSLLINSLAEYDFISDVMAWAGPGMPLSDRTPKTWDNWYNLPQDKSFIVKGKTNSRKSLFNTHFFAKTRQDVPVVASRLMDDMLISQQGLVVREYVPLKKLDEGINGMPISNEHRTIWLMHHGQVHLLAKGFYWASHPELAEQATLTDDGLEFARETAEIIGINGLATFFTLDVAETQAGEWILIEVNDGGMSGLGLIDPDQFYSTLSKVLSTKE